MNITLENITITGGIGIQAEVIPTDSYFNLTTMLLPGNGTNSGTNNVFLDSSTNNYSITRFGNTTQGTFSPFSQTGWGAYFDGSGDYLTIADNAALDMGSSNFTIEGWYFPLGNATGSTAIFSKRADGSEINGILLYYGSTGLTPQLLIDIGGSWAVVITSSIAFLANSWNHFAVVRNGSTFTLYINGISGGTATNAGTIRDNDRAFAIGAMGANGNGAISACYMSGFRVVKGTAVYTSNFTVPTTPLTNISGTSLLTLQNNRFVDNSSSPLPITVFGNTAIEAFSPFNPTISYSAANVGGSAYFDGSGDYLTSTAPNLSGTWTVEFWWYPTNLSTQQTMVSFNSGGVSGINIWSNTSGQLVVDNGVVGQAAFTTRSFVNNSWNHVAIVRDGSTTTGYINGVVAGTNSFTPSTTSAISIGRYNSSPFYYLIGQISSLRVVNGTAVYTGAFTPPTAPLTAVTNTAFLSNFTNGQIIDATAKNDVETAGTSQISTTQSKFGGSSISLDGSGSLITIDNPYFNFGTGNFTIETWIYLNSFVDGKVIITKGYPTIFAPFLFWTDTVNNKIAFYSSSNGSTWDIANNLTIVSSPSTGQWYHIAVTRSGSTIRTFSNGTLVANATSSSSLFSTTQPVTIGAGSTNLNQLNAYIDDLRITTGYARYTANFTVPSAAFPLN